MAALLLVGRSEPVRVHREPVTARLLVRRDGPDLVAEAALVAQAARGAGGRSIGEYLPVGDPPHGIAWFPGGGAGELHLARLAAVPPPMFTRLAAGGPLRVPAAAQDCFLSTYYPELAHHVEVSCPDGSVALPAPQPPSLELTLTTLGEHRLQLDWGWVYQLGSSRRREPLALPGGSVPADRDPRAEAQILDEAQAVDRTHRIGQTRNVMVYRMVAKDTIEEKVMALKERKAALTSSVLDGDDLACATLTADDIRSLLA